ncbi:MAG: hypothetical protein HFJ55_04200 [Clostridia bacterium]|jgi:uncharacterized protein YjdB/Tfp pilus assembly protein PilE|nr:hypothetical protein [Clostridia bacterium]
MSKIRNTRGITLIALVITIIILLILASVSIAMLTGKNGIIKQAEDAKIETARANFEDRLLLANGEAEMKRQLQGSLSSEEYFEILKNNEIISDVTVGGYNISEQKINEDGSKTYEIMSDDGYVFEATIYPDGKVETEYQGKKDNLPPKIRKITVTNKQTRGFDINVEIDRLENGTISYYYREANEEGTNEYIVLKENTKDLTASFTNLEDGKIYNIKVVVENEKGRNEKVINEAIKQLVKEIELNKTEETIERGQQLQLTATVKPETAENKTIEWSSSNTSVAEVTQDGLVTTKADGVATIKAQATDGGEAFAICNITVKKSVTGIELNENSKTIKIREKFQLNATITPSDATNKGVTWESSDTSIVTVNANGLIEAKKVGTATITVKSNENEGIKATCTVNVLVKTDYVADGLILWYDGINNTGTGTHSNTAKTWINLAGTEYDGTISGATWNTDHLSFDGTNDYLNIGRIEHQNFTLEVVASIEIEETEMNFINNFDGAGCGLQASNREKKIGFSIYSGGYKRVSSSENYELHKKYSISGGYNGTYIYISQNNKRTTQNQTGSIYYSASAPMMIGANSRNQADPYYCSGVKIYSARIYNRMLTESEVTKNYNVDKARFNIQ